MSLQARSWTGAAGSPRGGRAGGAGSGEKLISANKIHKTLKESNLCIIKTEISRLNTLAAL